MHFENFTFSPFWGMANATDWGCWVSIFWDRGAIPTVIRNFIFISIAALISPSAPRLLLPGYVSQIVTTFSLIHTRSDGGRSQESKSPWQLYFSISWSSRWNHRL